MRVRITAVMFVVLLSVAAPLASAQSQAMQRMNVALQGFVDDPTLPNNRILPETGVAKVKVEGLLSVDMYNRAASCSTPVQVDFTVKAPSYATAVMVPSTQSILVPGASSSSSQSTWQAFPLSAVLEVTVNRDAPAFVDGLYEVTMQARSQASSQATSSCDLGTSTLSSGIYRLKNDFTPRTSVTAADLFAKAGPNEKVVFPITVANMGNGPSRVTVSLQPGSGAGFRAYSVSPEVRLAGPVTGGSDGASRTIPISLTTPSTWGYTNRFSTMTATVTSTYDGVAPGTTFQESSQITFTVQTQGLYLGLSNVLGLPLILIGAVIAGAYGMKNAPTLKARWREAREEAARAKEEEAREAARAVKAAELQAVREAKEAARAAKAAQAQAAREAKEAAREAARAAKAAQAQAAREAKETSKREAARLKQEGDGFASWSNPNGRPPADDTLRRP